jgi:hypothetical protein
MGSNKWTGLGQLRVEAEEDQGDEDTLKEDKT